jgi:hypothetical protein
VFPALYHGIFMLKSNVDTSIELDTIKWLIDCTWIKPEVVATKKYTGYMYLHYRFITTGSRFLWSLCCSYMCFLQFLCGPANRLSVYDIVFPMFWTFLWSVNGSVSGPILHVIVLTFSGGEKLWYLSPSGLKQLAK